MARIRVLDEQTANQIAAGEVVERPASVVKELVENSLDAGARRIAVEVEGGGRELIRVSDDGCGMAPEDARLCLERHATSKIAGAADLQRITSLGFRGEALPSIAAVSRLEIRTRERDAPHGTRVEVAGGTLVAVAPVGMAPGTQVEVRDLFFNVPARLKFLKTVATELGRITDILGRLALAHPEVAFRFRSGPVEVFSTPGRPGDLLAAAAAVLGRDLARELVPVSLETPAGRIGGYVGLPAAARAGRGLQHVIVNGRPVTQVLPLRYAFEEAYANLIPQGRYPVGILSLEVDPAEVDVNVHPAKLEVRFQREREVRGAVYRAVRAALGTALVVPAGIAPPPPAPGPGQGSLPLGGAYVPGGAPRLAAEGPAPYSEGDREAAAALAARPAGSPPAAAAELIRSLRPLGQVHRSYIVCDGPQGLYILDQHAAHERIHFERILRELETRAVAVQPLLFPLTLELTAAQYALFRDLGATFRDSGIHAEPFGGRTVVLKGVPAGIPEGEAARLVTDFLDRLLEEQLPPTPVERRRRVVAALAACKASIRARDALQPEQITALLAELAACAQPGQCPHGRPTLLLFSVAELEKRFGRG